MGQWILLLEVGVAFFLLVFIVWWTMYQGRPEDPAPPADTTKPPEQPGQD